MTKLIRFSYINIYQQIFNILLYRKVKKTKFLKIILFSSLIINFLRVYKLNMKLKHALTKKRIKQKKVHNVFFKLYSKRLIKNIEISYSKLITFLSINNNKFLSKKQAENIEYLFLNKTLLFKVLSKSKKLSLEIIISKLLSSFLNKTNNINSTSILLVLHSNYGITPKYLLSYSKKYNLTLDETILLLHQKLNIFLLNYFPIFHVVSFQKLFLDIVVNGTMVINYKNFFLKIGDLISITNNNESDKIPSTLLFNFFIFIYILFSLNTVFFNTYFYYIKGLFFHFKNSLILPTIYNSINYKNLFFEEDFILINSWLITELIKSDRILNIFFCYEHSIWMSTVKQSNIKHLNTVLNVSFFLKKLILSKYLSFNYIRSFLQNQLKIKTGSIYFVKTIDVIYLYHLFLSSKLITFFHGSFSTNLNYFYLLYNLLLKIRINSICSILILFVPKKLYNSTLLVKHSLFFKYNNINTFNKNEKVKYFWLSPALNVFSNKSNFSFIYSDYQNYIGIFKNQHEFKWIFFRNTIHTFNGILQWSTKTIINLLIYSFPYLLLKPLHFKSTYQNKKLSNLFRYNVSLFST